MTTKEILEAFDTNSTVLANATVPTPAFGPANTSALHELNPDAVSLTTAPQSVNISYVIADVNTTVASSSTHDENLTFHNASSFSSSLTDAVTSPFVRQEISSAPESSDRLPEILTTEPGFVDSTTASFQWTTQILVDKSSITVGIAVGVTIAAIVLVAAFVALFVFLRRRKRLLLRRKRPEAVVENPRYTLDRDSSIPKTFDLTMHTGPMVRSHINNNSTENLTKTNGKRKKDSAAGPPIYKSAGKDSTSKRKPIPAPKHLGYEDLYEKDSAAGSTEALELTPVYVVNNQSAVPDSAESKTFNSAPLLESFQPQKKASKRGSKIEPGDPVLSKDEEDGDEDEEMKTALLCKEEKSPSIPSLTRKQKARSQMSESSA